MSHLGEFLVGASHLSSQEEDHMRGTSHPSSHEDDNQRETSHHTIYEQDNLGGTLHPSNREEEEHSIHELENSIHEEEDIPLLPTGNISQAVVNEQPQSPETLNGSVPARTRTTLPPCMRAETSGVH